MPSKPSLASCGTISCGKWEASSHSIMCGAISASANSRTVRRSACCSSVNEKSKVASVASLEFYADILLYHSGRFSPKERRTQFLLDVCALQGFLVRNERAKFRQRSFNRRATHIAMSNHADGMGISWPCENATRTKAGANLGGRLPCCLHIKDHDIGLNFRHIDFHAFDM